LPALYRRRMLSTHSSVTWPARRRERAP
jgi:hypothetical protein